MKKILLFIAVVTFSFSSVASTKSIASLEDHETDLVACLSKAKAGKACLKELTGEYFLSYTKKLDKSVNNIINSYLTWIGDKSVFSIYKVNDIHKGDFQVRKTLIVEDNKGNIFMIDIIYRRSLGKWKLKKFSTSNNKDKISKALSF